MDCLHPVKIENPMFKNGIDIQGYPYIFVPCGNCEACIVNNANEWRTRLSIENDCSETSYFVTLTYDDDKIPIGCFPDSFGDTHVVPYVCKRDVQLFIKRLRKRFPESNLRYYLVSEYGPTTYRPHYHMLLFNLPRYSSDNTYQDVKITKILQQTWANGFITVDSVTFGRISYVTKYLSCVTDLPEYLPKPFRLMSRNPGIGATYLDKRDVIDWHRCNLACYYPDGRFKKRLPRYLKDKIFDDEMKCLIKDDIDIVRKSRLLDDAKKAEKYGYHDGLEYRKQMIDKMVYKFNKKLKKQRKDV